MILFFIRHAQSENNARYVESGSERGRSADPELTTLGRRQADCLARHVAEHNGRAPVSRWDTKNLAGYGVTHLYTSLMVRAVATADALGAALGLEPVAWPDLHERGGIYLSDEESGEPVGLSGRGRSYFASRYPRLALPADLTDAGWWNRPRETGEEAMARARRVGEALLARHGGGDDRVAVISHGGFYDSFLTVLLGVGERADGLDGGARPVWMTLHNTGISRFDWGEGWLNVVYLNRTPHLPPELLS